MDIFACAQEKAFVRKYPARDPNAWQDKAIKYRPSRDHDSEAYDISMGPLVGVCCHTCRLNALFALHTLLCTVSFRPDSLPYTVAWDSYASNQLC